jgi:hypothetical protein
MSSQVHPGDAFDLPLTWVEFDDVPILFANHFLVQHQLEEFVLSVGQVTGPPLVGTPEEISEQAARVSEVPINTLVRVGLTRHRLTELIALLQAALDEHDRVTGG